MAKILSRKAINLLRKVEQVVADDPRKLDMSDWGTVYDKTSPDYKKSNDTATFNSCGTVARIAGWACILSDPKLEKTLRQRAKTFSDHTSHHVGRADLSMDINPSKRAARLLGISSDAQHRLFHVYYWPTRFRDMYYNAITPAQRKTALIKRVEFFIETDSTDGAEAQVFDQI